MWETERLGWLQYNVEGHTSKSLNPVLERSVERKCCLLGGLKLVRQIATVWNQDKSGLSSASAGEMEKSGQISEMLGERIYWAWWDCCLCVFFQAVALETVEEQVGR